MNKLEENEQLKFHQGVALTETQFEKKRNHIEIQKFELCLMESLGQEASKTQKDSQEQIGKLKSVIQQIIEKKRKAKIQQLKQKQKMSNLNQINQVESEQGENTPHTGKTIPFILQEKNSQQMVNKITKQNRCFVIIQALFFIQTLKNIFKINNILSTQNSVEQENLPQLDEQDKIESYYLKFNMMIQKLKYSSFFISLFVYNMIEDFSENNQKSVFLNAFYLTILTLTTTLSRHQQYIELSKYGGKMRQIFITMIMNKVYTLSNCSVQLFGSGAILNFISSDLSYLEQSYGYIYCIPIIPVSFIVSGWILWDKFQGAQGLMAVVICILTYPIQTIVQKLVQYQFSQLKLYQDQRIKQQSNFVDSLQTIKMYCWQEPLLQMIYNLRKKEWKQYLFIQFLTLVDRAINQSINIWGSLLFLILVANLNVDINMQNVILTIQLMSTIRYYCVHQVSCGFKAFINLNVIFKRANEILLLKPLFAEQLQSQFFLINLNGQTNNDFTSFKEITQFSLLHLPDKEKINDNMSYQSFVLLREDVIFMKQICCYWNKQKAPILKNINFSASNGQLISIIGKTGCGKSSMLQLILKEIPYITGALEIRQNTTIRYVDQDPFINPTSIKENILFGKEFDEELFLEVIYATNIFSDIMLFPDRENTQIGENGATLSGGQRARLSLARALYSMPDVYLLDDPLSAVDSKVAKHIFMNAIQHFIFKYQPSRQRKNLPVAILATHHLSFALKCDVAVVLDDGQIVFSGKTQDVAIQIEKILNVTASETEINQEQELLEENKEKFVMALNEDRQGVQGKFDQNFLYRKEQIFKTLKLFLQRFSYFSLGTTILLNLLTEAIRNIFYRILTSSAGGFHEYLLILIFLVFGNIINNISKYFLCSSSILKANNKILAQTMEKLANAKKQFLDKQTSGAILSKYTSDFSILDSYMFQVMVDILEDGLQFVVSLTIIAVFQPLFIIPIFLTISLSSFLFVKVTPVLSQLKQNDLNQRSQLFSHFNNFLKGLTHFRISEQLNEQKQQLYHLENKSFQSNYFYHQAQKCFSMYIDLFALIAKTSGIFLIIIFIKDEASFSQALLLLQSFHSQNTLLRQLMEFIGLLNSYTRLFDLLNIEQENDTQCQLPLSLAWPKSGAISVKKLSFSYEPESRPVLNEISFEIQPGEKVAFIGRTGAGKSSIIVALFRLIECNKGGQIFIDERNIQELSLNRLRCALAIIPQQPFFFQGTLKQNLDPFNEQSEKDIWRALIDVGMDIYTEQQQLLLETQVSDLNLSAGQKQLFCLARAILFRKKIIILDEASANIDLITDEHIQEIISQKFIDCTIIAIAHRITTISHYHNTHNPSESKQIIHISLIKQ